MNQYIVPQEDIYGDNFLFPYVSGLNIPPHHQVHITLRTDLSDLEEISFRNLRLIAKKLEIVGRRDMNKETLINAIRHSFVF